MNLARPARIERTGGCPPCSLPPAAGLRRTHRRVPWWSKCRSRVGEMTIDDDGGGDSDGDTVASVIPTRLENVITASGETASAAFDNKPIYTIDVSEDLRPRSRRTGARQRLHLRDRGRRRPHRTARGGRRKPPAAACRTASWNWPPAAVVAGGSSEDFLVVEQGCALIADGTAGQPIVFTAKAEVLGNAEDNDRGLWGGLVVNGYAPSTTVPKGPQAAPTNAPRRASQLRLFGGSNAADNSGVLRYVSVRFAGSTWIRRTSSTASPSKRWAAPPRWSTVQAHNNLDDGVEFFGGTVDAKHVVLTGNADDSLDWTGRLDGTPPVPLHRTDGLGGQRHRSGQPRRRRKARRRAPIPPSPT